MPFFERYPLRRQALTTSSASPRSCGRCARKEHLTRDGFERLAATCLRDELAGKQRSRSVDEILAESSETVRQARDGKRHRRLSEDTVRSSWRHEESGRNDLTLQMQPTYAE